MNAPITLDISDYTIDYVRIRLPLDMYKKMNVEAEYNELAKEYCSQYGLQPNCFNTRGAYNYHLRRWDFFWNIWGYGAEAFFREMTPEMFKQCTRLDVRKEIDPTNVDFEKLFHLASARNTGKGTVKHYDSPYREKIGGRDAGGKTVQVGGDQSQRKLNIYQRGKERPAIEVQLSGKTLQQAIEAALGGEIAPLYTVADTVKEFMCEVMEKHVQIKLGYSIDQIEKGVEYASIPLPMADEEGKLVQMEILWEELSDEAKDAFIEGITGQTGHIVAVASVEPDGLQENADQSLPCESEEEDYMGE